MKRKCTTITKKDDWMDGELTAFALTIEDMPAIALFNYSKEGYGLLELREGEREGYVCIEKEGYVFIYIDERYHEETVTVKLENNKELTLNVEHKKGQLIVETQK